MYAAMLERLDIPDGADPEDVRKAFDNELSTAAWGTPGKPMRVDIEERDPAAPSWWIDEEDASQSFLASMGVVFPDG
jgi:hypothetical protein